MNYFIHLLQRLKARGNEPTLFIDAGAHFGETNETIRSIYPNSRVISFEANPSCEPHLKSRCIEYVIGLLGSETIEKVPFYINPNDVVSTGCSIYKEKSEHFLNAQSIELPMYALDDVIPEEVIPDFLKMDVQGAELSILDGAERILKNIKWVYLEVSFVSYNEGAPLFKSVSDYLYERGYIITDECDPTYVNHQLVQTNFLFERK